MAIKRPEWKKRLLEHPLFLKLAEYGKMIDKCADLVYSVNRDIAEIRSSVKSEFGKFLSGPIAKAIRPVGIRKLRVSRAGKYYISWAIHGDTREYEFIMLNIQAIAHGRVSNALFPLAYILGCVSDFELLTLSNHPVYGRWIKSLLKQYPLKGVRRQ